MTADSAVDDAMAAVLGTSTGTEERRPSAEVAEPGERRPSATVAEPGEGPCSKAEAEELVERAIAAAETFYDTIVEIIRRQAWVPLGYANPRDLMLRRLGGTTVNPITGKPYSRSHVHRMARVSWMLWAISTRTGVDPGDLEIPERTLRELGGGMNADLELVDTISDRVAASIADKNASPDDVQDVLDSALSEAVRDRSEGEGRTAGGGGEEDFDSPLPDSRPDTGAGFGAGDDDDFDDSDRDDAGAPAAASSPALDAFGSFDDGEDFGDENSAPVLDHSDALSTMRANANYVQHLKDIREVGGHLPDVIAVQKQLPQFLDIVDDDELEELKELVEQTRNFVDRAQKAREAMDAVLAAAGERLDF